MNLSMSRSFRHLHILGKLFSEVSLEFLRDSMCNNCKKDHSKCSQSYSNKATKNDEECGYGKFLLYTW